MPKANKATAPGKGVHVTITAMAGEVSSTRETITKRIADANLQPSGQRGGFPVYRLKELLAALHQTTDGYRDPDKLPAFERNAHYKAEREKLDFERELGLLVPFQDVERSNAHIFKCVARSYDTLPDILERDCGLTPAALAVVERHLDAARLELHADVNRDIENDVDAAGNGANGEGDDVGNPEAAPPGETERGD